MTPTLKDLKQKVTGLESENARLRANIQQIVAKASLNWMEMASLTYAHSLRRTVGEMRARLHLLNLYVERQEFNEIKASLEGLDATLSELAQLPITAPLSYENSTEAIDVNLFLTKFVERTWQYKRFKEITLKWDLSEEAILIWGNVGWLWQSIEIVINNAVQALQNCETKCILFATQTNDKEVIISIEDTGPGIPSDVQHILFKEPIPKKAGESGMGIGLLIAQQIAYVYNGIIDFTVLENQGTRITYTFPRINDVKELQ